MAEQGFDAAKVGELAGKQPPPPREPSGGPADAPSGSRLNELLDYLGTLLSQYGDRALSDADKESILQDMRDRFGLPDNGSIIDVRA